MFKKLFKNTVKKLSDEAVKEAEKFLGAGKGKEKKKLAVSYVIDKLPVPGIFKPALKVLLSDLIDESIEFAVRRLNTAKSIEFAVRRLNAAKIKK